MGNTRRIRKLIQPKIAMADTHVAVNGCRVFLGHVSAKKATENAKAFRGMLANAIARSSCPNIHDMYAASLAMQVRMEAGEPLLLN